MPLLISDSRPTIFIRRDAFERIGLNRGAIDTRFNLTDEEFHVEGNLVVIGPLPSDEILGEMVVELETAGLAYFDDFFELSGNWPGWLKLHASSR